MKLQNHKGLKNHKQGYSVEVDSKMEPLLVDKQWVKMEPLLVDKQWVFYHLEIKKPNYVEEFCTARVSGSKVFFVFMVPI
jgi:hypothetical protein